MRSLAWAVLAQLSLGSAAAAIQDKPPKKPSKKPPTKTEKPEELITAADLRKHVEFLASDELRGRRAGSSENDKATQYIADRFKEWGLKEMGTEGYFQPFTYGGKKGQVKTRNVVALLEGGNLKDEYVLYGAHCDHLGGSDSGKGGDGIYNGADDNASGSAQLLEVARAFAEGGVQPRRSVIFIAFNAEEAGLKGSAHYVANPPKPLSQHAAVICSDMVGRNQDKPITIKGAGSAAEWPDIIRKANDGVDLSHKVELAASGATDYLNFIKKNIPSVDFFSGFHGDYHKVGDSAEKLGYERMEKSARVAFKMTLEVANREGRMSFTPPPKGR
jgi:hypothetical protein